MKSATIICIANLALVLVAIQSSQAWSKSESEQLKKFNSEHSKQTVEHDSKVIDSSAAPAEVAALPPQDQPIAEKKQGDQVASSSQQADSSIDEYVEVKPEELNASSLVVGGGELGPQADQVSSGSEAAKDAESAVDGELSAHLAEDTILQQESVPSYETLANSGRPAPRVAGGLLAGYVRPQPQQQQQAARSSYKTLGGYRRGIPLNAMYSKSKHPASSQSMRIPPSYTTLKGKLTGINSIISQYPHPAPGYPHHGPRHLPRGAAAGYAAFRDFVRAHASKYKHASAMPAPGSGYNSEPQAHPMPMVMSNKPAANYQQPQQQSKEPIRAYPVGKPASYGAPNSSPTNYQQKNKVSVAQAFIPHLAPSAQQSGYDNQQAGQQAYNPSAMNPILTRLYGSHAPQGVGKPEYSKDFGMVLHYPQATVYTEPMTVEQLHRLTGGGLSHVIEQLQQNLANGHRDESNMIRANNKHFIGHGLAIHAKEYYAPGKSGQYVPTTAAVISSSNGHQDSSPENQLYSISKPVPELGSGYERVKQAVNAQAGSDNKYGGEQSLGPLTNYLNSELESIYKSNYNEQRQHQRPRGYEHMQSHRPSFMQQASGNGMRSYNQHSQPQQQRHQQQQQQPTRHYSNQGQRGARGPRKEQYAPRPQAYGSRGNYRQPQAAGYNQAEQQALNKQMQALLQDFHLGDDQYNGPPKQNVLVNQGYPNKIMQKYQQQSPYKQPQQQQNSAYHAHEGIEIPHSPNDQIGEISELIEALKGSLEEPSGQQYKAPSDMPANYQQAQYNQQPQAGGKQAHKEEVRYLTSTLGQVPSYALQVPVINRPAQDAGHYNSADLSAEKKVNEAAENGYRQHMAAVQQAGAYHQQQQQQQHNYQPQRVAPSNYGQADRHQHHQQQQQAYNQQQQDNYAVQQAMAMYNQAAGYGDKQPQQQQQHKQQQNGNSAYPSEYQQEQHSYQQQGEQLNYQQQQSGYGAPAPVGPAPAHSGYAQQQAPQPVPPQPQPAPAPAPIQQEVEHPQQQQQQPYSSNEHSQVINHLVPVASQTSEPHQQQQQQYSNQIGIAAPTEQNYQQAQSLSSFVDSLPSDYQELLRQPAQASLVDHQQQDISGAYSNQASVSVAASAPAPSAAAYTASEQTVSKQSKAQSASAAAPATSGSSSAASSSESSSGPATSR